MNKELESIKKAKEVDDVIKSFAGVMGIVMIGNMVIELINKVMPKVITLEFDSYYIADLRLHWKEMLEQKIGESFE